MLWSNLSQLKNLTKKPNKYFPQFLKNNKLAQNRPPRGKQYVLLHCLWLFRDNLGVEALQRDFNEVTVKTPTAMAWCNLIAFLSHLRRQIEFQGKSQIKQPHNPCRSPPANQTRSLSFRLKGPNIATPVLPNKPALRAFTTIALSVRTGQDAPTASLNSPAANSAEGRIQNRQTALFILSSHTC